MPYISQQAGYLFIAIFALVMIIITKRFTKIKNKSSKKSFLVANRNVNWIVGGTSIAASWIWAPALFISVQMAYQKGLAGIFWFTTPNILALALFAIFAPTIRKKFPEGFTLPQFIKHKLKSNRVHKMYLVPYIFYQIMAVTVQLFAGGSLFSLLTGIPLIIIMPLLALTALTYTLISGLKASITTDFLQIGLIVVLGAILIPLTINAAGGTNSIINGLHGIENVPNILDPTVAFSFGIVTSIGLIAGAISDQQYWQRSFAIKQRDLRKAFIFGAILFGIVPLALSVLGFIAANPSASITLPQGIDVSMIGVQTVASLLPKWALLLFVIMLLAGLSSTLDSGLTAAASLYVTDVTPTIDDNTAIAKSRKAMIGITIVGLAIALAVIYVPNFGLQHLWWVFNTIAACIMVPTILILYSNNLNEKGIFYGILIAFLMGIPGFIYGNITNNTLIIVGSTVFIVGISTIGSIVNPKP